MPVGIVYLSAGQFQLIAGLEVEGHGGGVAVHIIALHGAEFIGNILGSDLAGEQLSIWKPLAISVPPKYTRNFMDFSSLSLSLTEAGLFLVSFSH